jgi:hypothetical protein
MKLKHVDFSSQQLIIMAIVSPPAITRKGLGGGGGEERGGYIRKYNASVINHENGITGIQTAENTFYITSIRLTFN